MERASSNNGIHIQSTPWQRCTDRLVVGLGVDEVIGVAVPAMLVPFLPEASAIQIRLCDPKEGERCDGEKELNQEENPERPRCLPFPWDGGEA